MAIDALFTRQSTTTFIRIFLYISSKIYVYKSELEAPQTTNMKSYPLNWPRRNLHRHLYLKKIDNSILYKKG